MIASLEVTNGLIGQPVPTPPLGAIVRARSDPNGYAVFVVEENCGASTAQLRTVEIGDIYGNTIAVTAGLKAGERIIVTGATPVSEREVVRIIP